MQLGRACLTPSEYQHCWMLVSASTTAKLAISLCPIPSGQNGGLISDCGVPDEPNYQHS